MMGSRDTQPSGSAELPGRPAYFRRRPLMLAASLLIYAAWLAYLVYVALAG